MTFLVWRAPMMAKSAGDVKVELRDFWLRVERAADAHAAAIEHVGVDRVVPTSRRPGAG